LLKSDPNIVAEEEYDSTENVLSEKADTNGTETVLKRARALFDYQAGLYLI
jgi:hypothetical protein